MEKVTREEGPITITLGNLVKLYKYDAKKIKAGFGEKMSNDLIVQTLLGNGKDILIKGKIDSGSTSKIYNCAKSDGTPSSEYGFVYEHYEEIVKYYYSGNNYAEGAKRIRGHVFAAWKNRLKDLPEYDRCLNKFLTDYTLNHSNCETVEQIYHFLQKYSKSVRKEDKAEVLTVLTLLAITRGAWERLPIRLILPEVDKGTTAFAGKSAEVIQLEKAKEEFAEQDFEKALELLDNLERMKCLAGETVEELKRFNGKVAFLRSQVRREILKRKSGDEKKTLRDEIKNDLESAVDYGNSKAMIAVAAEYHNETSENLYEKNWEKCKEICEEIIKKHPNAIEESGKANWLLYLMETDETKKNKYLKDAAVVYSYEKAIQIYRKENVVSLINTIERSEDETEGIYYINDNNLYFDIICKTAPGTWKYKKYPINDRTNIDKNYDLFDQVSNEEYKFCRVFLISDNFERNLRELLHFLQVIKDNQKQVENGQFEFFIRGEEEKIAPFVDTALARLENLIIPVYILDDPKMATRVLAQHPLFYPIRNLEEDKYSDLKFVVIGSDPVCEWLVREAYWMLTFRRKSKIRTEIIILSPDAENIRSKLIYKCPKIELQEIDRRLVCSYESEEFVENIKSLGKQEHVCFAISAGSDLDNMALAVKIRELSIQARIELGNEEDFVEKLPVIAFHCQDPDIANLSCRTVVINENRGEKWFNNYELIPFGRVDEQYHWNALTNHILEQLSLNVHLQYYIKKEFDIVQDAEQYKETYAAALRDYYGRSYNRDSSMAVAMSLPYRMFQGKINGNPILPFTGPFNILDSYAFFSEEARENYIQCVRSADWKNAPYKLEISVQTGHAYITERLEECFDENSEVYQLAEWEQERWRKFMISRGWCLAKEKDMKFYFSQGNKRQQLYIGKMHPCMIDFKNLEVLEDKWYALSQKEAAFRMNNITAIQNTEDILSLKWTEAAKKIFDMNGF